MKKKIIIEAVVTHPQLARLIYNVIIIQLMLYLLRCKLFTTNEHLNNITIVVCYAVYC